MPDLSNKELNITNVGLRSFCENIQSAGGSATHLDWEPPANGDSEIGSKLADLVNHKKIEVANDEAFGRYLAANPVLAGVGMACENLPNMVGKTILHAGAPVDWRDMCGPMKGSILGAAIYEGWVDNLVDAEKMADHGEISFDSCHHHNAVGPMAGIISPSMPVWIINNTEHGNQAFTTLNEGLGKVLRFGANSPDVIKRLKWMEEFLAPTLNSAIQKTGPIELKPLISQALHMGDEVHNRNAAGSSLLIKKLVVGALGSDSTQNEIKEMVSFISGNDHFFLNLSMPSCKAMLDVAHGVPHSSMVTAMARNGVEFAIRVSGLSGQWFTTPAPVVDGLYFPGYSMDDAAADLGDSAITETSGLGGFAMAASPAITQFVGGSPADALLQSRNMRNITIGTNSQFTLPALDFAPTAAGIDVRKVVDTNILPVVNTGIAHKEAGVGQIGAGITSAPLDVFVQTITPLHKSVIY
ncbi:MAG: hypothetical protein CFH08_01434 [Alphaproteobacteria bacterium MarineAlpha3_Bin7]|nr:MAG: hypothetical protein CFH08_01434 [Alphaproteobacteria bacterium MarineAlpha3_Bin7]|tara:strand:- start:2944 stop:4350 length:1407 start_codon:yes stop_codon:yes gene_type:complete